MRFFTNDRAGRDDRSDDERNEAEQAPERVQSDPVPVPHQRPATTSPWAAAPAERPESSEGVPQRQRYEVPVAGRQPGAHQAEPEFHEPAPQPTAFGAATVGGAVAASAAAGPATGVGADPDRRTDAASGVADDRTVAPGDGAVGDDVDPAAAHRAPAAFPVDGDPDVAPGSRAAQEEARGNAAADTGGPTGDRPLAGTAEAAGTARPSGSDDVTLIDEGGFNDPVVLQDRGTFEDPVVVDDDRAASAVDTRTAERRADNAADDRDAAVLGGDRDAAVAGGDRDATVADDAGRPGAPQGVPAEQLPGGVPAPTVGPLFGDPESHAFRDRWRDVQLRFVDDPKAATDEAAALLDEVVDALAARLREQKGGLSDGGAGTSTDTEALRVRLRGYRDFLDRLLGL